MLLHNVYQRIVRDPMDSLMRRFSKLGLAGLRGEEMVPTEIFEYTTGASQLVKVKYRASLIKYASL